MFFSFQDVFSQTKKKKSEHLKTKKRVKEYCDFFLIINFWISRVEIGENLIFKFKIKKTHSILIGLSTSGDNQNEIIQKALDITINNQSLFDSFQVTYNVFDQSLLSISKNLIKLKKQIIVKEALANGRVFPNKNYPNYNVMYKALGSMATKYNVGVDAIALRFCMDTINPYMVLSGAAEAPHIGSNLQADSFQLSPTELDQIKALATTPSTYWNERKCLVWNLF